MNMDAQVCLLGLWPINTEKIGTINMYKAVINPDFAVVVYLMPICWATEALKRKNPQQNPAKSNCFFCSLFKGFFDKVWINRGAIARTPSQLRVAKKVNGPTRLAPILWATKAIPQIRAVRINKPK